MAKEKAQTENVETIEVKEKAKQGTSLAARAKQVVLSLSQSLKENAEALVLAGIHFVELGELHEIASGFAKTSSKGLPLAVQLANIRAEQNEILRAAPVVDGLVSFTEEDQTKYDTLSTKAKRLTAMIANGKKALEENPD